MGAGKNICADVSPLPVVVRQRRRDSGLTQVEAADLIHKSVDTYRRYERGRCKMALAVWELFMLKTEPHVLWQESGGNWR